MAVEVATGAQQAAIERLLHMARYVSSGLAAEDLPTVISRGFTLIAGERAHPWGVLVIDPEERPESLPPEAPDRAEVRAYALRHGPWLPTAGTDFGEALGRLCGQRARPLQLSAYATERWQQRFLQDAGFAQRDTVIYLRRPDLAGYLRQRPQALQPPPGIELRPAELLDLRELAALDAETFIPLWHYSRAELIELLLRARMQLAIATHAPGDISTTGDITTATPQRGAIVGYSALLTPAHHDAHLARLAVHPTMQGQGIGRLLLDDAMAAAHEAGAPQIMLNTQLSNLRSQQLYRAAGFVTTGMELPVFVRLLAGDAAPAEPSTPPLLP
jgi:ribosomal protein S18 acetylase RimI-like enzyme